MAVLPKTQPTLKTIEGASSIAKYRRIIVIMCRPFSIQNARKVADGLQPGIHSNLDAGSRFQVVSLFSGLTDRGPMRSARTSNMAATMDSQLKFSPNKTNPRAAANSIEM
ncbi:MAG: hypothetical protein ABJH45_19040 [Paracoccaceae bacterium]